MNKGCTKDNVSTPEEEQHTHTVMKDALCDHLRIVLLETLPVIKGVCTSEQIQRDRLGWVGGKMIDCDEHE